MTAFRRLIIAMAIAAGLSGGQTRAAAPTWKFGDVLAASNGFTIEGWTRNTSARQADLVIQTWSDPAGHSIRAEIQSNDDLQIVKLSAQASKTAPLPVIHAKLPWAAGTRADRIFSAAFGGSSYDWPKGFAHGNASTWPGYGYSPIAMFYESASGAGLGLTAFNDSLRATQVMWVSADGPGVCGHVRFNCALQPSESDSFVLELRRYESGLPQAHAQYYRSAYLLPWLKRVGIEEAIFKVRGPWAYNGWPSADGRTYRPGDLVRIVTRCKAMGAQGYAQWSTADGKEGDYYQPDQRRYPWFAEYPQASAQIETFGALINPFVRDVKGPKRNLGDAAERAELNSLRDDLKKAGVKWVFWDTGSNPTDCTPAQWLGVLRDFRAGGVVIAPESSCDVAASVTGSVVLYTYRDFAPVLPRLVSPQSTVFMLDHAKNDWWDKVEAEGIVPILTEPQLWRRNRQRWAQTQRSPATVPAARP